MKDYIEERVLGVAKYIIDSKSTIRKTAMAFGVSKSTIHKDMTERLPKINPIKACNNPINPQKGIKDTIIETIPNTNAAIPIFIFPFDFYYK